MQLRRFLTAQFLAGALILLAALIFYYFAVLRIDYHKTTLLDLAPHPDATEYFAQAQALHRDGWPSIQIGFEKLPSRYPFGYPLLMLPWLKVLPQSDAVLAPFRTSQVMGLSLILAVFVFYAYLAMPLTGGFAALLLATLPGFFTFCRSSLSEVTASLFIVLAFMFAYLGLWQERRWKLYLSAVLLGLSVDVRLQSLFFAPLLLAMTTFRTQGLRQRSLLHFGGVLLVFVLAASPVLVLNTINFHSPLKTGYDLWVPYFGMKHLLFCVPYVPRHAVALWRQFTLQPHPYDAANIFGTGTSFVPPFILLSCAGLFFIRVSWFFCCAFLAGFSSVVASLSYLFGHDARFYLPVLILVVALAVLPVTWAAHNVFAGKRVVTGLAVFAFFVAACLGYPSMSGYGTHEINRSQSWDAVHFTTSPPDSIEFLAQRQFARQVSSEPGVVLSDIDPVYLNALLPRSFFAAPIDSKHHYRWSYIWRYDRLQALALVQRGLEQSLPVYALFVSPQDIATNRSRLPTVAGYEWRCLDNCSGNPADLKLVPAGSDELAPPQR